MSILISMKELSEGFRLEEARRAKFWKECSGRIGRRTVPRLPWYARRLDRAGLSFRSANFFTRTAVGWAIQQSLPTAVPLLFFNIPSPHTTTEQVVLEVTPQK